MTPPTEKEISTAIEHGLALARKADAGAAITAAELMLAHLAYELSRTRNTTGDLFAAADGAVDSPKLAWMKKHGIATREITLPSVSASNRWFVYFYGCEGYYQNAYGATEDEALANFARIHHLKLWNEEGA